MMNRIKKNQADTETLLLVDDHRDNLLIMKAVLGNALPHATFITFQHPEEVMNYGSIADVSVAVFDVQMPVINGIELCRMLKASKETQHIPVILVTSHDASSGFKAKGLDAGADDFLTRPIDNNELVARIKVALRIARAEAQLRRTANQVQHDYQMLFNRMLSGFAVHKLIFDANENPVDFSFQTVNPAFEKLMDLRTEDVVGKTSGELFPELKPKWMERYERVVATGKSECFEAYIAALDRHVEVAAFRTDENQFATLYSDITERKRAETEKERLMKAIEQVMETIMITDTEGAIQYVNPAFETITGYSREEAIGETPCMLKSGQQNDAFYQNLWSTLLSGETWTGRFVNRKKDGTLYTEEAAISPVKNVKGTIVNYVAIKADITTGLVLEEQLRQSQKMESIGRLAGGIAHDFNNILQSISGFSEMLMMRMDAGEANPPASRAADRADVEEIHKAALHAAELTRQLLTFSRKQPVKFRMIDLNTVLAADMRMLERVIEENINLQFNLCSKPLPVTVDASQIVQIVMNLVTNARDAIPVRGTVLVATQRRRITEDEALEILHSRSGDFACLSVTDDGHGMNAEQLTHLFEPFYTNKDIGKGTGLGLSMIYGIVQSHHGWINVSSTIDAGTTFQIYLPIQQKVDE